MSCLTDPLLVGRGALLADLAARVASGRHTLLVAPAGLGKTRLLLRLADLAAGAVHSLDDEEVREAARLYGLRPRAARLPARTALYAPECAPAGRLLDALAEALHACGRLALPDAPGGALAPPDFRAALCARLSWHEARRRLPTLDAREAAVVASLSECAADDDGGSVVLLLDGLDRATASGARLLARLQGLAPIVGAVRAVPPSGALRTFFLALGVVEVPPLPEARVRELAAHMVLTYDVAAADPRHFTRELVRRADGNPAAARAMLHDAAAARLVSSQDVRDLQSRDDAAFFNMGIVYAPLLILGGLVRVMLTGAANRDLYVVLSLLTVVGYLVFRLFRPFFSWQPSPDPR